MLVLSLVNTSVRHTRVDRKKRTSEGKASFLVSTWNTAREQTRRFPHDTMKASNDCFPAQREPSVPIKALSNSSFSKHTVQCRPTYRVRDVALANVRSMCLHIGARVIRTTVAGCVGAESHRAVVGLSDDRLTRHMSLIVFYQESLLNLDKK